MRVAIAGAGGRMGRALIDAVLADRELTLAAAFDVAGSPAIGTQIGGVKVVADPGAAIRAADLVVDFTRPEGTLEHLAFPQSEPRWNRFSSSSRSWGRRFSLPW